MLIFRAWAACGSSSSCAVLCARRLGELLTANCIDLSLLIDYNSTYFKEVIVALDYLLEILTVVVD